MIRYPLLILYFHLLLHDTGKLSLVADCHLILYYLRHVVSWLILNITYNSSMPCSSPKSKSNESRSIEAGIGLESPGPTDDYGFAVVFVERGWLRLVREAAIRALGLPDGPSPVSAELELLLLARELALRS